MYRTGCNRRWRSDSPTRPYTWIHPNLIKDTKSRANIQTQKTRSALHDVVTREYTIHLHKRVHDCQFKKSTSSPIIHRDRELILQRPPTLSRPSRSSHSCQWVLRMFESPQDSTRPFGLEVSSLPHDELGSGSRGRGMMMREQRRSFTFWLPSLRVLPASRYVYPYFQNMSVELT